MVSKNLKDKDTPHLRESTRNSPETEEELSAMILILNTAEPSKSKLKPLKLDKEALD
jgi:hypothetical protein